MQHDGSSPASRTDRFFEQGEGKGEPAAQFYGAILRGLWWWWAPPIAAIALIFIGLLLTSIGLDSVVNKRLAS